MGGNRGQPVGVLGMQHDETLLNRLNRLNISKLRRSYEMDQDGRWGSVVGASDLMICMYVVQSLANHGPDVNKETSRGGSEGH